jgi:hypothetical protein
MAVTYYEKKVIQKTIDVIHTLDLDLNFISAGTKDGKRAVCAIMDPQTKDAEVEKLIASLKKRFRKAEVVKGAGVHKPYAPELNYPNVYIIIKDPNR